MEELMEKIVGNSVFSMVDLRWRYSQFLLAPEARYEIMNGDTTILTILLVTTDRVPNSVIFHRTQH